MKTMLGDLARAAALIVTSPKTVFAALQEHYENRFWYSVALRVNVVFFVLQIALRCWIGDPSPLLVVLWVAAAPVVVLMPIAAAMRSRELSA